MIESDLKDIQAYISRERSALNALTQKLAPIRNFFLPTTPQADNNENCRNNRKNVQYSTKKSVNFSPTNNEEASSPSPEMAPLSQTEFDSLPKYLKGRLTVCKINSFIRDFNRFTTEKYTILLRANPAKLSTDQRQKFFEWKNLDCPETTGKFFITEADLKAKGSTTDSFKFDQVARNILTILRQAGRIKEVRSVGIIRYLIIN